MKQRNLRLVPAALLMTTALSWSLPSLAQTSAGSSTAPARPASAAAPSIVNVARKSRRRDSSATGTMLQGART